VATRKDQLDAFNFARRRMVANLVVPTATGSDEGAPRPVKTFASSIILSALAVVAVMVIGVFKPSAPNGWEGGLAVDSSTGAAYVTQNKELHAVYNITSARLILGKNFSKYDVPDATLNSSNVSIGSPVGILGAPEDEPSASSMNLTQWSYCQNERQANGAVTSGGQNYLEIGYAPSSSTSLWTSNSAQALIVHDNAENVYLIDGNYKYEIGNDQSQQTYVQSILTAVNQGRSLTNPDTTGFWVSDAWLSVFSSGAPLTFPKLANLNGSVNASSQQPGTKVGQYGQVDSATTADGAVQTEHGVMPLSPFAYYLYEANSELNQNHVAQLQSSQLTQSAINEANSGGTPNPVTEFEPNTYGSNWPKLPPSLGSSVETSSPTAANICVGYNGQIVDGVPQLSTWTSATLPYGTVGTSFGVTQSGGGLEAGVVLVKPGSGLIAQQSSGTGTEFLIEDSGFRYPLGSGVVAVSGATPTASSTGTSQSVSAITQLGYDSVSPEKVPPGWVSLLQGGAELNPATAGKSPQSGS
jgi:type VII secretion protein EccB